jgi:hypothetical protein
MARYKFSFTSLFLASRLILMHEHYYLIIGGNQAGSVLVYTLDRVDMSLLHHPALCSEQIGLPVCFLYLRIEQTIFPGNSVCCGSDCSDINSRHKLDFSGTHPVV